MGTRIIKLPDVGEGVAEAEIVEWHVEIGQSVLEDQVLAAVMTDKATVEIPSPVAGTVVALGGEVGSVLAVGAELVRLEVAGGGSDEVVATPKPAATPAPAPNNPAPVAAGKTDAPDAELAKPTVRTEAASPSLAMPASISVRCAAAGRRAASATTISTPSCAAPEVPRQGRRVSPTPASRPSR